MDRRSLRTLAALGLVLGLMAGRASACRNKGAAPAASKAGNRTPNHWITPLMTAPPPRPTVTMWKGTTRVPQLPE